MFSYVERAQQPDLNLLFGHSSVGISASFLNLETNAFNPLQPRAEKEKKRKNTPNSMYRTATPSAMPLCR